MKSCLELMHILGDLAVILYEIPSISDEQVNLHNLQNIVEITEEIDLPIGEALLPFLEERVDTFHTYRGICAELCYTLYNECNYIGMPHNLHNPIDELDIEILYSWIKNESDMYGIV